MSNIIDLEEKRKEQKEVVEIEQKVMDLRFISIMLNLADTYFNSQGQKVPMIYVLGHFMCAMTNIIINHTDDKEIQLDLLDSMHLNAKSNVERWQKGGE